MAERSTPAGHGDGIGGPGDAAGGGDDLHRLRDLLLGRELRQLDALDRRVADPALRARDAADILADAVTLAAARDTRLAEALQRPVGESLKAAVRRDPAPIADSLFPVVGPLVRRSIAESLRASVQSLHRVLRHAFSLRGLRLWLESRRTGIAFADLVLRHAWVWRIERLFLIRRGSGLLLAHVAHPDAARTDSDAVSGMLTALEDFVHDSFAPGSDESLSEVEVGERMLWVEHGPHTLLAAVVRGAPPPDLRVRLAGLHEQLHAEYGECLRGVSESAADLAALCARLETGLVHSESPIDERPRERPWLAWLVVAAVVAALLVALVHALGLRSETRAVRNALEALPGVVVLETVRRDGVIVVRGLQDPLVSLDARTLEALGIPAERIRLDMVPYQSMDPTLVRERIRAQLRVPPGVDLGIEDGRLVLVGEAPVEWIDRATGAADYLPGVERVEMRVTPDVASVRQYVQDQLRPPAGTGIEIRDGRLYLLGQAPGEWLVGLQERVSDLRWIQGFDGSGLTPTDASLRAYAVGELRPPTGVELQVRDAMLYIRGIAPWSWVRELPAQLNELAWFDGFRLEGLEAEEAREALSIVDRIERHSVYFIDGADLTPRSAATAGALAGDITRLDWLAQQLGANVEIQVVGHTDALGDPESNRRLRAERARVVLDVLRREGMQASAMGVTIADGVEDIPDPVRDLNKRRVDFVIRFEPPTPEGL